VRPIPFLTVRLPDPALVAQDYAAIYRSGIVTNGGPVEQRFTAELERWIGNGVAVSVISNATTALQLACRALFDAQRRSVLVASFTYAAGPLAIRWAGFEPVLLDVTRASWQPDPDAAEQYLERAAGDVAGILLTSTFGTADAAIGRWEALAQRFGLPLVVDSAAGFGSSDEAGQPVGAHGDCEVFSFHATKTVAIGEGGALAARNHDLITRIDQLKNFGFDDEYQAQDVGLNGKLGELASAIGLRQLEALPDRLARRHEVLVAYVEELEPLGCEFQPGARHSAPPYVSTLLPSARAREALGSALDDRRIGWRTYYNPPVHRQPLFADAPTIGDLTVTEDLAGRMISLPLDEELSRDDVATVVSIVREVIHD
jgi:dTDP-4-amino-4,6-dideoxygalactose transaminase